MLKGGSIMGVEINKIYNEDCFITMSNMDDNLVDIVMTSPPYNMTSRKGGYADSGRYDVYEDWMSETEYIDFSRKNNIPFYPSRLKV
jgi:DNA modification methylase